MAKITKETAIVRLQTLIDRIDSLLEPNHPYTEFIKWKRNIETAISYIFGEESHNLKEFKSIIFTVKHSGSMSFDMTGHSTYTISDSAYRNAYVGGLKRSKAILESMVEEVQQFWDAAVEAPSAVHFNDESSNFWQLIHPVITDVARSRFESRHFADSVEAAFKKINAIVKSKVKDVTGSEFDGAALMNRAFSVQNPIIRLDDLTTETGKNIQQGYMQLYAGAMIGIRNPKAHDNVIIDNKRAIHFLFLASLLMYKLDESV